MSEWDAKVYHIPFDFNNTRKSIATSYFALKKLFRKIKPQIVHSHLFYDGISATLAAKHAGVKVRIHTKQSTGINWQENKWAVKIDRWMNRKNTHLIAVSAECREFMILQERCNPNKIVLIHHGINPDELTSFTKEDIETVKKLIQFRNEKIILNLSRCVPWKNQKDIILASHFLQSDFPDAKFICAGQGPILEDLKSMVKENKLNEKVIFTGNIDKKLIPALFAIADVYLHAAKMEPFGFVIPEAMFNKVPIVSTPTGSARDGITHLESGYLANYDDPASLAAGIKFMLSLNENKIMHLTSNALANAQNLYHIDVMYRNTVRLYHNALNS
jgi:glycosyltransferase involved in cell wall biosynthesis